MVEIAKSNGYVVEIAKSNSLNKDILIKKVSTVKNNRDNIYFYIINSLMTSRDALI